MVISKTKLAISAYFAMLLIAMSRELLDLIVPSGISYAIQLAALIVAAVVLPVVVGPPSKRAIIVLCALVAAALASVLATFVVAEVAPIATIAVTSVNLLNLYFVAMAASVKPGFLEVGRWVERGLQLVAIWVVVFALLQYAGFLEFSGAYQFLGNTRLTGALGSMQHLSIVLALMSIVFVGILFDRVTFLNLAIVAALLFALVVAFTRIGYFIFFGTCAVFFGVAIARAKRRMGMVGLSVLCGVLMIVTVSAAINASLVDDFATRLSGMNLEDASNQERVWHWMQGIEMLKESWLVVGSSTGFASQIPNVAFGLPSRHFESGQIQYLLNFGVFFWLGVVALFLAWAKAMPRESLQRVLPLLVWAGLFIYMFNEVVPVFVLLPAVSMASYLRPQRSECKYVGGSASA